MKKWVAFKKKLNLNPEERLRLVEATKKKQHFTHCSIAYIFRPLVSRGLLFFYFFIFFFPRGNPIAGKLFIFLLTLRKKWAPHLFVLASTLTLSHQTCWRSNSNSQRRGSWNAKWQSPCILTACGLEDMWTCCTESINGIHVSGKESHGPSKWKQEVTFNWNA